MTDVIEGTAEEIGTDLEIAQPPRPPATLFGTDNPAEVIVRASAVAASLKDVLRTQNMVQSIKGKEYVKVEGWQTLGSMLGVVPVVVWTRPVDGGWEARVEARTADGRTVGAAESMCVEAEGGNWGPRATSNARRSMAQTRAVSKALRGPLGFVVTLAGYQATPAEEMPRDDPQPAAAAPPAPEPLIDADRAATIGLSIHEALQSGAIDGARLSLIFTASGAQPTQINAEAVRNLTASQAASIEADLLEAGAAVTA